MFQKVHFFCFLFIFCVIAVCNGAYGDSIFRVNNIIIDDMAIFNEKEKSELAYKMKKKYQGKEISNALLGKILSDINNYYIRDGYITTRASVPEQNLKSGNLTIEIHPGIIGALEEGAIRRHNLAVAQGDVLNIRDMEQRLDYMNRLRSSNVTMKIKPGADRGTSIIELNNDKRKKWYSSFGIDNYSSKKQDLSKTTYGTNFNYNLTIEDLFSMTESMNLSYRGTLHSGNKDRFNDIYSGVFSIPFGYNLITLSCNRSKSANYIDLKSGRKKNKSANDVANINIGRTVHRSSYGKLDFDMAGERSIYSSYFDNRKLSVQSYHVNRLDIFINQKSKLESSVVSVGFGYSHGRLKTRLKQYGNSDYILPKRRFNKFSTNLFWLKPLPLKIVHSHLTYNIGINLYYSPEMLVGSERQMISGMSCVRGFKENSESGETAMIIRNELSLPIELELSKKMINNLTIFGGYDFARFRRFEDKGASFGNMSSVSIGMRSSSAVNFSLTFSVPIEAPEMKKMVPTIFLSAMVNL